MINELEATELTLISITYIFPQYYSLTTMGFFSSEKPYNVHRVKSNLQQADARIKLQQNKGANIIKMERRKLSDVMKAQKHESARVQVESLIRSQEKIIGLGIIQVFCGFLINRLQPELYRAAGSKVAVCPVELKEPLTSCIWATSRLDTIPELVVIREEFGHLLGKDFIRMAQENREFSVSDKLVECLAPKVIPEAVCVTYLRELAAEYGIDFQEELYCTGGTAGLMATLGDGAGAMGITIPPIIVPRDALEERLLALKRQ